MEMHFNTSEVLLLELVLIRYVNLAKVGVYRSAPNISQGVFSVGASCSLWSFVTPIL